MGKKMKFAYVGSSGGRQEVSEPAPREPPQNRRCLLDDGLGEGAEQGGPVGHEERAVRRSAMLDALPQLAARALVPRERVRGVDVRAQDRLVHEGRRVHDQVLEEEASELDREAPNLPEVRQGHLAQPVDRPELQRDELQHQNFGEYRTNFFVLCEEMTPTMLGLGWMTLILASMQMHDVQMLTSKLRDCDARIKDCEARIKDMSKGCCKNTTQDK